MSEQVRHVQPARSLATRVLTLVAVGTLGSLSLLGFASWSELRRADATLVRERDAIAQSVARDIDEHLTTILSALQSLTNDARGMLPLWQNEPPLVERLHATVLQTAMLDAVFVVTLDGELRGGAPAGRAFSPVHAKEAIAALQRALRPQVIVARGNPKPSLLLLVPFRSWRGEWLGVVGGEIEVGGRRFVQLMTPLHEAPVGPLDVVDRDGNVIATNRPRDGGMWSSPVVAAAPLALASWRVLAHRSDGDLGPVNHLFAVLSWLGPLLVGTSLLLAWGAARSVRGPLLTLTDAAERLAAGDLETPVTVGGADELGRLGHSFETMRRALKASYAEIEHANAVLETRVEERTRELARLNRELRDREVVRQSLLRKVITAQEDERKRIARELHDEACQTVTALGLRLETAIAAVPEGTSAHSELKRMRELATRSLDEIHRLMHDLRPALIDDLGLVSAIRWYAERRLAKAGIAVRFESTVIGLRVPVEIETALFRAVQETLTNVERHAGAEMVLVQVSYERGELVIDVEDDGVGFDPAAMVPTPHDARGLGLLGIRERLELVGGIATIDSSPGSGTHVAIRVPLPAGAVDVEDQGVDR